MYIATNRRSAGQYVDVLNNTSLVEESPHKLIQMLMEGFLTRINSAKGAMAHGDIEAKCRFISLAIGIVGGLNESLNVEVGGEMALNLRSLYEYINRRLLEASAENSLEKLDEVFGLMRDIKEAWDAIA